MAPERPLKIAVIILSLINAVLWLTYTKSIVMAIVWTGTAIGFVRWVIRDIRESGN